MSAPKSEVIIVCEGYHDRAFWAGWLLQAQWQGPEVAGQSVKDPWDRTVGQGQFGYWRQGRFLRVVPAGGKDKVLSEAARLLTGARTYEVRAMVLNADPDFAAGQEGRSNPLPAEAVRRRLRDAGLAVDQGNGYPVMVTPPVATGLPIHRVLWQCDDGPADGLPAAQTLERLVCAAILAAYPPRGSSVQAFLGNRPGAPALTDPAYAHHHKDAAMTHMAGWYAPHGSFDFYREVWRDSRIAAQLEARLRASGAWDIVAEL
jgi:hypothetical protein